MAVISRYRSGILSAFVYVCINGKCQDDPGNGCSQGHSCGFYFEDLRVLMGRYEKYDALVLRGKSRCYYGEQVNVILLYSTLIKS